MAHGQCRELTLAHRLQTLGTGITYIRSRSAQAASPPLTSDAHGWLPSLGSTCRCEKIQVVAIVLMVRAKLEQLWNKEKYKDDNPSSVYVFLCLTLPLSMETLYRCNSFGHQKKGIRSDFDRISQTEGLRMLHIALYAAFELLPTFHIFLTSSKVCLEMWFFQKTHLKVHTSLQVGLKHIFVLFLKTASKWQLLSHFQTSVVQWNFLVKLQRYEEH